MAIRVVDPKGVEVLYPQGVDVTVDEKTGYLSVLDAQGKRIAQFAVASWDRWEQAPPAAAEVPHG
jgi:hypothetical protein